MSVPQPRLTGKLAPHLHATAECSAAAGKKPKASLGYVRERDLPRLIAIWPAELVDEGMAGHGRLVAKIRRALREERQRGKAGHWSYDLARHSLLHDAYKSELMRLAQRMTGRHDHRTS